MNILDQEVWTKEVRKELMPKILKALMQGDTSVLRPWLSEAVYAKVRVHMD